MNPLKDGNYLATGADWFGTNVSIFLFKFDIDGNTLWRRTYQYTIGVNLSINQVKEDADGSIIAVGTYIEDGLSFLDRYLYLKFNAAGGLLLAKSLAPPGEINVDGANDFIIKDGFSYVAGLYHNYYHSQGALLKIDNNTGTLAWSKYYSFNNKDPWFTQIFPYGNNELCMVGTNSINMTDTAIVVRTDIAGNVLSSKYMANGNSFEKGKAVMDNSGNIIWFNRNYDFKNSVYDFSVTRIHPQNGIDWAKEYQQLSDYPFIYNAHYGTDSSIYFVGGTILGPVDVKGFVGRLSKNGNLSCDPLPLQASFGDASTSATDFSITVTDKIFTEIARAGPEETPRIGIIDTLCYMVSSCTSLQLTSALQICQNDTIFVHIQKSCTSKPLFIYDARQLQLASQTDTLVKFKAVGKDDAKVLARIISDCQTLQDSVHVWINASMPAVNLGQDSSLCTGNTILLNAHKGYSGYIWQDGSTDSTFIVKNPGTFNVITDDACGNRYYDTAVVSAAPPIPFDAGPDRIKCNSDTLHINAPSGFLNYTWSNNYNLSSTISASVVVNPLIDTTYFVKAEKTPGCFAYDTVHIIVHTSPPLSLGNDTSFCSGQSVVLTAPSSFSNYRWNTGDVTQQIKINSAGIYSLVATTQQGCSSTDTIRIINVFSLPVLKLNKNPELCQGSTRILDPGSFASYQWQDGSLNRTYPVTTTGLYFVTVSDQHGCLNSDTAVITKLLELPAAFLPSDTSICSYGSMILSPASSYRQYVWSTGASSSAITIFKAGIYWLQVTDSKGCVGKDTIVINPKECLVGLFVPNAFTPNQDYKNDEFKALLFGNVKSFEFTVYNRWGQVIFKTNDRFKGWDGKVGGVEQRSDVFVWTCRYQLEGEPENFKRGTVTLIR